MALSVPGRRVTYFPAPKNACTSLKLLFYELCHGEPFVPGRSGNGAPHIHKVYDSPHFLSVPRASLGEHRRLVVVRDPVERFLSCYASRVIHHEELSSRHVDLELARKLDLEPDPPLGLFIKRLDEYRLVSPSIRHHTEPQTYFFGHDLTYFTHVYRLRDLTLLANDLGEMLGREIIIPHEQTGGPKIPVGALAERELMHVMKIYSGDYALLHNYFSPETVLLAWTRDRREGGTAPRPWTHAHPPSTTERGLDGAAEGDGRCD